MQILDSVWLTCLRNCSRTKSMVCNHEQLRLIVVLNASIKWISKNYFLYYSFTIFYVDQQSLNESFQTELCAFNLKRNWGWVILIMHSLMKSLKYLLSLICIWIMKTLSWARDASSLSYISCCGEKLNVKLQTQFPFDTLYSHMFYWNIIFFKVTNEVNLIFLLKHLKC